MENKYYTPTIEEFHVGFEYLFSSAYQEGVSFTEVTIDGKDYEPETFNFDIWNYSRGKGESWKDLFENMLKYDQIRVKYLDKADIEELGFEFIYHDEQDNTDEFENGELTITVHYETHSMNIYRTNLEDDPEFYTDYAIDLFIKNKSELKVLLKQLGI